MGGGPRSSARNGVSERGVVVRNARDSDIEAVLQIERGSFADPWSRASFETALDVDRMLFLVAERVSGDAEPAGKGEVNNALGGSAVVAYAVALLLFDEAEIADIAVSAAERQRGIGGLILDAVLARARAVGVQSMYLEVRESNASARALYSSRSFADVGRRRGYYQHPVEDALLMRRDLQEQVK